MSFINYAAREINVKIVFYGPGLCGKTTNLQYIFEKSSPQQKGKLISLATETDRTLFFDFLPLDLGAVRGFKTRFHLYTVPGQVFYDASRKLILKGVDGVVFVADSQEARMDANVESLRNLEDNLRENGFELKNVPYVLQFNKRDLPSAVLVDDMYRLLNYKGEPTFEAVATKGMGVFETLKAVAKQVLVRTSQPLTGRSPTAAPRPSQAPGRRLVMAGRDPGEAEPARPDDHLDQAGRRHESIAATVGRSSASGMVGLHRARSAHRWRSRTAGGGRRSPRCDFKPVDLPKSHRGRRSLRRRGLGSSGNRPRHVHG